MRLALAAVLLPCLCLAETTWTTVRGHMAADPSERHGNAAATRLDGDGSGDAVARSAPVPLAIGNRYELSGWIRTESLHVRDLDRSPIAVGAALSMASMPFDVHSESVGDTTGWTRVRLHFIATAASDAIQLTAGEGGTFSGKAWFADVTVKPASPDDAWPAAAAIQRYGPAYRYPIGGWIYLHIEGAPYERGYQHGHLMWREIVSYMDRCSAELDSESKNHAWETGRTIAKALFERGFDREILEEMRGIADGAADAGARWDGRRIDLIDIVTANTVVELEELHEAMPVTPDGLEGVPLKAPSYDHCSAFAATGPATRDGRMVIGHLTMWPLTLAEQTNVMLDIKPAQGHQVLIQSFPGGIQSGTDWLQNDAGIVLTETTIDQSPYNIDGVTIAFRARRAIQYSDNIDDVVKYLGTKNDGLYTNEWLIGDAKTNEIAMYDLGTYRTKLWRSSRGEWFGGTEGFYWGDNNAKDLNVRLEGEPDPAGEPRDLPYWPDVRDIRWQQLYRENKGRIDEQFAFTALRTAPLVSSTTMDAKVVTAGLANRLMTWAVFGKSNDREWVPTRRQKEEYEKNDGIYSSGYRVISTAPPAALADAGHSDQPAPLKVAPVSYKDRRWKGWILPAGDADLWLAAGSAAYYYDLGADDLERAMDERRVGYRNAAMADPDERERHRMVRNKGALLFDALRRRMGDDKFFDLMNRFFTAHTTKTVNTGQFIAAAGEDQRGFIESWLKSPELPGDLGGDAHMLAEYHGMAPIVGDTIIVYGTVLDAGANRYAAEQLQRRLNDLYESEPPVRKDFELSNEELSAHHVIFVGRPETNSALAHVASEIRLDYRGATFRIAGVTHASERESLALAANNPLNPHRGVFVVAGNSALETVRLARTLDFPAAEYAVYDAGKESAAGFLK